MRIIDAHAYVGPSLFGLSRTIDDLLRAMDGLGIDMAVLCPSRPPDYALGPANKWVAKAIGEHRDRFYGWARVDPWQGAAALQDLEHAHQDLGLHGLLLHPWEELCPLSEKAYDPLVDYAAEHNLPVLIETGYPLVSHPLDVAEVANRHPKAKLIGTHGLQLDSSAFALLDAETAMRECPNLHMESSGMYAFGVMETVVHELGSGRLIFGSHSPWLNAELELARIKRLSLTPAKLQAVLCDNIEQLIAAAR